MTRFDTLLVGTNNAHKAREIQALLPDVNFRVVTPRDLGIDAEPEENGSSFEENARIKARYYAERSGLPCLADDSGLAVDALDGRPGIYSARYAPTTEEQIARLLGEMDGVPTPRRAARYVCAAALCVPAGNGAWAEVARTATCEGEIATAPEGSNGFGYDPVFFLPDIGRTMAQISAEEKNARSHRGKALAAIKPELAKLFS